MKKIFALVFVLSLFVISCASPANDDELQNEPPTVKSYENNPPPNDAEAGFPPEQPSKAVDWRNAELKDINSGETFTISQFDKPVIIESFAVWCPICTKQQQEIKKLHEEIGDEVISISLDTDPNEDEEKIKMHAQNNGFTWKYVVSPAEVTKSLIAEFGTSFVNAPSAPTILLCKGKAHFLKSGVKSKDFLKQELESKC